VNTKAIVFPKAHTVEVHTVELKALGDDDVLVRTRLSSISAGTERMLLRGVMPHPMLQFPVVPGYETVGDVIDGGAKALDWLGKRVYVGGNYGFVGVKPAFGGQSAHIVAPASHLTDLHSASATLSDEQGVLLALSATALHGVERAGLRAESSASVLLLGQGIVGQLAARFAKAIAPKAHVSVLDINPGRLQHSQADRVLTSSANGSADIKDIDVLIDATGKMDAITPYLMRMQRGGRVVLLGYYDTVALPYQPVFLKELTLIASMQWAAGDLGRARDLLASGVVDTAGLITHRQSADDAAQAFDVAFNDAACLKMVLTW
jgi:bacteriochlorophyllide a dehydrogenase